MIFKIATLPPKLGLLHISLVPWELMLLPQLLHDNNAHISGLVQHIHMNKVTILQTTEDSRYFILYIYILFVIWVNWPFYKAPQQRLYPVQSLYMSSPIQNQTTFDSGYCSISATTSRPNILPAFEYNLFSYTWPASRRVQPRALAAELNDV